MTYFKFPLYIYPFSILVSYNQSDKTLKKHIEGDFSIKNVLGRTFELESGNVFIRFKKLPENVGDLSVISHEAWHATQAIMRHIGCYNHESSEEAYAYLHDYIVAKILEGLQDYLKELFALKENNP